MFIVLFPRIGIPHIFSYQLSNGHFRAVCGKILIKEKTTIILAADQVYPGLCSVCSQEIKNMYENDLKSEPRIARNYWQMRLENLRDCHYQEMLGPSVPTINMINRKWKKLIKYINTLVKNK